MKFNFVNNIDCYKLDHRRQYPEGTQEIVSNFTPRGSRVEGIDHVVFFGLQGFIDDLEASFDEFLARDVDELCAEYEQNTTEILGPNDVGSDHIRALHNLGYLPLEFRALPEGTKTPLKVPMFTIRNTHPDFFWLVNYLETWVSSEVWLPSTSATTANHMRELLVHWAKKTGSAVEGVDFQLHDFSSRGLSSNESAAKSGAGHLLSFLGSDTLPAKDYLKYHYRAEEPILLSVAATEHSVMCAGGSSQEEEYATYERLLNLYPSGIVSVVSDTYDLWNVITNYLPRLKDQITARDGKLVIRPDSGDPADILCGTIKVKPVDMCQQIANTPEEKGVIELLWEIFGGTVNEAGYKELDPHIGAIYGDSITYDRADDILRRLADKGFASSTVVFGVGSYTYQYVTRDTFGFAMKATNAVVNGEERPIFKDPKTDKGEKKSAKGRLVVLYDEDLRDFALVDEVTPSEFKLYEDYNWLRVIWKNGLWHRRTSLQNIKERLHAD